MKREFLEALNLDKDTVDKILDEKQPGYWAGKAESGTD